MKRSAFKPKLPPPRPVKVIDGYTPRPRAAAVAVHDGKARMVVPVPKDNAIQHQGYMAIVRTMACARCGIYRLGLIQFCHADILGDGGKGMGLKSDCRLGWPGCGPHGLSPGCHWEVGTSGQMTKEERHRFEAGAGRATRAAVTSSGRWPKNLPRWPADELETA